MISYRSRRYLAWIIGLALIYGCESSHRSPLESQNQDQGAELKISDINNIVWTLSAVEEGGSEVDISGYPPFHLIFTDDRFLGDDGCNWFGAPYQASSDSIYPGDMVQTVRLCIRASFSVEHLMNPYQLTISKDKLRIHAGDGIYQYRSMVSDSVRSSDLTNLRNFRLNETNDPEYQTIQSQLTPPNLIFEDNGTFKLIWYNARNDSVLELNQISGIYGLGRHDEVMFYLGPGSYEGPGSLGENFMHRILLSSSYRIKRQTPKGAKLELFNAQNGINFEFEAMIRSRSTLTNSLVLDDTMKIAYKDTVSNHDENISLTFDSLFADSRCPVNVDCVWEGNAEIGFVFSEDSAEIPFTLNTSGNFITRTTIGNYDIKLVDVFPVAHTDSMYVAEDYSVRVVVSKK